MQRAAHRQHRQGRRSIVLAQVRQVRDHCRHQRKQQAENDRQSHDVLSSPAARRADLYRRGGPGDGLGWPVAVTRAPTLLAWVAQVPVGFILITANAAPSGSESTAKRPGGMSIGGTSVVAPAPAAFDTVASESSTAK